MKPIPTHNLGKFIPVLLSVLACLGDGQESVKREMLDAEFPADVEGRWEDGRIKLEIIFRR